MPRPRAPQAPKSLDKIPLLANQHGRKKVRTSPTPKKRGQAALTSISEVRSRGFETNTMATAALVDPNKPLTQMQKDFVREWAKGESILSASYRAGYADGGTYAYRMARMPNILRLYNEEKAKYEEAAGMTRKKVMDGLLEAVEMAKLAGEPSAMIAGWKTVGQMCGYFEPARQKVDITVTGNVMLDRMNRLTDAELLKLIQDGVGADLEALKAIEEVEDGG